MENKRIEDADFSQTGYSYTLSLISGEIQAGHPLLPDGIRAGALQPDAALPGENRRQDPERDVEGIGAGRPHPPRDVPGDTAEGGIHADRTRAFADARTRPALYVGDRKPAVRQCPQNCLSRLRVFPARGGTVIYMERRGTFDGLILPAVCGLRMNKLQTLSAQQRFFACALRRSGA